MEFFCSNNELQVPEAMVDMVALNSNQKHIQILFKPLSYINISGMRHWTPGSVDCGVNAIANAVSLHFGLNPEHIIYESIEKLREYLVKPFLSEITSPFPCITRTACEQTNEQVHNKSKSKQTKYWDTIKDLKREKYARDKARHLDKNKDLLNDKKKERYAMEKSEIEARKLESLTSNNNSEQFDALHYIFSFKELVKGALNYEFCTTRQLLQHNMTNLQSLDETKSHIEIIPLTNEGLIEHWICVFYNFQSIFIYQMTQSSTYDKRIEMLRYLFPYHITANKLIIIELMENSSSGPTYLYCIAIATSLFWKFKLQKIKYDQKLLFRQLGGYKFNTIDIDKYTTHKVLKHTVKLVIKHTVLYNCIACEQRFEGSAFCLHIINHINIIQLILFQYSSGIDDKKVCLNSLLESTLDRQSVSILLTFENNRSDGTSDARTLKYFLATCDRPGYEELSQYSIGEEERFSTFFKSSQHIFIRV
ncbi:Uncharacterized protein FWK35_00015435 [Aphis craccivora]|uniref:Uncharacterized protein n=1 Tax=Aphis craccivora TaxID=307492 RepID=A0A6G0Y4Y9_APHCR|nr:Uncharacterized protein FWK35_00015435 [Aphis craccivora]